MATNKFHISDDGIARKCDATKKPCRFGNDDEHYSTKEEAQKAFEREQSSNLFSSMNKKYKNKEYTFTTKTEEYGIDFKCPDVEGSYQEDGTDGSSFYRFEQLDELFDDYGEDDVETGYRLDLPLNTLQQYISKGLVEDYVKSSNMASNRSLYADAKLDKDEPPSIMRLLVHKGEFYIVDGNHRFAAARVSGQKEFSGIVMIMNDDMSAIAKVAPHHFNRMVERKRKKI